MYVRKGAVLSGQLEGTQRSLNDLLAAEASILSPAQPRSTQGRGRGRELRARQNYGLNRLHKLPLSVRLIREIHGELLRGVRGSLLTPGDSGARKTGSARAAASSWMPPSCRPRPRRCPPREARWNVFSTPPPTCPPCSRSVSPMCSSRLSTPSSTATVAWGASSSPFISAFYLCERGIRRRHPAKPRPLPLALF